MLADILEGLPITPYETSYLAAKGHKQYEYYIKALTDITRERTGNIEHIIKAKVETGKELESVIVICGQQHELHWHGQQTQATSGKAQAGTDWQC